MPQRGFKSPQYFLGRAFDGKLYYSTHHFCIRKLVLGQDEQPASLKQFVETYSLRGFDGRSDECLNKTWPPKRK
jgi:hypothetical protein